MAARLAVCSQGTTNAISCRARSRPGSNAGRQPHRSRGASASLSALARSFRAEPGAPPRPCLARPPAWLGHGARRRVLSAVGPSPLARSLFAARDAAEMTPRCDHDLAEQFGIGRIGAERRIEEKRGVWLYTGH